MLKMVNGKWAIVSKSEGKPLVYYKGEGKPSKEWIEREEKRIKYFKHKKEEKVMKTYKVFAEELKKWKDVKNSAVKREAGKMLKALDKGEVLAYSVEHGEFTIFKDEMEFVQAQKGKGKAMKWIKVEGKSIDGQKLNEAFNFKGAVKHGFLDKFDKPYVDELEKKGWEIEEFILTSKGFEILIKKGSKRVEYIDKTPSKALKQAAKKAK